MLQQAFRLKPDGVGVVVVGVGVDGRGVVRGWYGGYPYYGYGGYPLPSSRLGWYRDPNLVSALFPKPPQSSIRSGSSLTIARQ